MFSEVISEHFLSLKRIQKSFILFFSNRASRIEKKYELNMFETSKKNLKLEARFCHRCLYMHIDLHMYIII